MLHSEKVGKYLLCLIFCCIATIVLLRNTVRPTHYISPDSISYLRAADLIQQKNVKQIAKPTAEKTTTLKQLLAVWPAGYPASIALIAKFTNINSLVASKIVNLLFLGFIFILLYKWVGKFAWLPALYFFSFGKLEVFSFTWSEGGFLFFVLLLCYTLHQALKQNQPDRLLFLKLFFCLTALFLFRYAGLIYFFLVAGFLFFHASKKQFPKAIQYFIALFLSSSFVLFYFYQNYLHTGYFTGGSRVFPEKVTAFNFLIMLFQGLANEFFLARNYFFNGPPDFLFLALLILQLLVLVVIFKYRKLITSPFFDSKARMLLAAGIFYLFLTIILRKISPFDKFDFRILAPFSTPVFIAFLCSITQQPDFLKKTYKWIAAFMIISLLINLPKKYLLELFRKPETINYINLRPRALEKNFPEIHPDILRKPLTLALSNTSK